MKEQWMVHFYINADEFFNGEFLIIDSKYILDNLQDKDKGKFNRCEIISIFRYSNDTIQVECNLYND